MEDREFYVYEHWRPDTGLPFYVGKGKGNRAFGFKRRGRYHKYICAKLKRLGFNAEVRVVFTYLDEATAFVLEKAQINYWRSHNIKLANLTDGGEGAAGYKFTKEQCRRASVASKKSTRRPEVRAKISKAIKQHWGDPEQRMKHAEALTNSVRQPKVRAKLRAKALALIADPDFMARRTAALRVVMTDPEFIARRARAIKLVTDTPESKARRSAASIASRTPEVRARISATLKAYKAAQRAAKLKKSIDKCPLCR